MGLSPKCGQDECLESILRRVFSLRMYWLPGCGGREWESQGATYFLWRLFLFVVPWRVGETFSHCRPWWVRGIAQFLRQKSMTFASKLQGLEPVSQRFLGSFQIYYPNMAISKNDRAWLVKLRELSWKPARPIWNILSNVSGTCNISHSSPWLKCYKPQKQMYGHECQPECPPTMWCCQMLAASAESSYDCCSPSAATHRHHDVCGPWQSPFVALQLEIFEEEAPRCQWQVTAAMSGELFDPRALKTCQWEGQPFPSDLRARWTSDCSQRARWRTGSNAGMLGVRVGIR